VAGGEVAAVVPVWNRRELIGPVMSTLAAQTCGLAEILVVDNGSTDGAAETAAAAGARVLRMGVNTGFATAVNRGLAETAAAWIAVVNNDVTLAPDYLALLREAADRAGAWFATGRILSADGARIDGSFDVLCRGGCAWRVGQGEPDGDAFSAGRSIYSAPWTAVLLRRALIERVGPLDARLGSYMEDVEFGVRCAAAGCAGLYVPEARAWHQGSATLGRWSPAMVRLLARNQVWIAARRLRARDLWHVAVAQLLWGLVALRHGAGAAWLTGKCQGIASIRDWRHTVSPVEDKAVRDWLRENEEIVRRARSSYWKLYSLLTPRGAL
jgi:GT2 family glycosyltransferase